MISFAMAQIPMNKFINESSEFMTDAYGHPMYMKTVYNAEGSPFFNDNYVPARLSFNGRTYSNIPVKINLSENTVLYDRGGVDFVMTVPVQKIELYDSIADKYYLTFQNGFPGIGELTPLTYYQVIDSGKATLLKHIGISYRDDKPYYSATVTRTFEQTVQYYILTGNKMTIVPKNTDMLTDILKDTKNNIASFIEKNKLKISREQDLEKIISHFNNTDH